MLARADTIAAARQGAAQVDAAVGPLVLVVEDEPPMQSLLRIVLKTHGLRTVEARSGAEALERAAPYNPDLVLLALGPPHGEGIDVMLRLREWMTAPILVVSACGQERDKVAVLDAGANDYLTKPFANGELLARIRVWIRQSMTGTPAGDAECVLEVGDLRVDLARRVVSAAGRELHLTPIEDKVFLTLMRNRDRVMTRRQLLEATWGPRCSRETQYLRVYMGQLRKKLEHDPSRPRY